jgi:hypothetical protein
VVPRAELCNGIDDNCNGTVDDPFVAPVVSCSNLHRSLSSGVYPIDSDGSGPAAPFNAYCDMSTDGGGWTLTLKSDGSTSTFSYGSSLWTNTTLLNPTSLDTSMTEAKLQPFVATPFNQALLVFNTGGTVRSLRADLPSVRPSPLSVFTSGFLGTGLSPSTWHALVPGAGIQPHCNTQGFNATSVWLNARIGLVMNQENDCHTPDTVIGLGLNVSPSTGSYCGCCNTGGTCTAFRSFGYLYTRDSTAAVRPDPGLTLGTSCTVGVGACTRTGAWVCNSTGTGTTCSATPGTPSPEVCDNIDNDCDGVVDDGLTRSCYGGPSGTAGVGACRAGTETCSAGSWGTCVGEVRPSAEVCDNVDNNCNGTVDEGLTRSCYTGPAGTSGVGICRPGTQTCVAGSWGSTCPGEVVPSTELCNGIDDNCNGMVDDPFLGTGGGCHVLPVGTPSGSYTFDPDGPGAAAPYTAYCDMTTAGGGWTQVFLPATTNYSTTTLDYTMTSGGVITSAREVLMAFRDSSMNVLSNWATFPMPANWRTQAPFRYLATDETILVSINGAAPVSTTLRYGYANWSSLCTDPWVTSSPYGRICMTGTVAPYFNGFAVTSGDFCPDSSMAYSSVACSTTRQYSLSVRGGGLSTTCWVGVGACARSGTFVCAAGGLRTVCSATPGTPTTETCNGIDDNCNGTVDEGVTRSCYTGPSGTAGVGICRAGTQTCVVGGTGTWGACTGQVLPATETCNGVDDNCNGVVDDPFARPPSCVPSTEVCNGVDDNCNGIVDDLPALGTASCPARSCTAILRAGQSRATGYYWLDSDGAGGAAPYEAWCDMSTDGGGWTLIARSRPGGTSTACVADDGLTGFGWRIARGSVYDDTMPYSLNAAGVSLSFSEILFGDYTTGKTWGSYVYKRPLPADYLSNAAYRTGPLDLAFPPIIVSSLCGAGSGWMFRFMGYTDSNRTYTFRDVVGGGFGLSQSGWHTCYNDCPSGGGLNGRQGQIMARGVTPGVDVGWLSQACTVGVGACARTGAWVCNADGSGTTCSATPGPPATETCNGIDDDCDGIVDDGFCRIGGVCYNNGQLNPSNACQICVAPANVAPPASWSNVTNGTACSSPSGGICTSGVCGCPSGHSNCSGVCRVTGAACSVGVGACLRTGTIVCSGTGTACSATPGTPTTETCNGIDDDCDGIVDDGFCRIGGVCYNNGQLNPSNACQTCVAPANVAPPASWSNVANGTACSSPSGGICTSGVCGCPSGQSNCSGVCRVTGAACSVGVGACLRTGTIVCSGTGTACSATPGTPTTETCNGVDDNCNGTVDEGPSTTCAAPIDLGTLSAGGSVTRTEWIPAPAGSEQWYYVRFPLNPDMAQRGTGTPQIALSAGPSVRFDVLTSCSSALSCGSGGSSTGLTAWSFSDTAATPGSNAYATRATAWPTAVYIRVYRVSATTTCATQTLTVSRPVPREYQAFFTVGVTPNPTTACSRWNTFRASIDPARTYTSVTLRSSVNPTGRTCTGSAANTICQALRNAHATSPVSVSCGGVTWTVGQCYSGQVEINADGLFCNCSSSWAARPCHLDPNFGGVGTGSCGAANQNIIVSCN